MHTQPMSELEGTFGEDKIIDGTCRKCGHNKLSMKIWESSDGGYEDAKYTCVKCGHYFWVEGPDS